jgi:Mpv17 / PMP22 family
VPSPTRADAGPKLRLSFSCPLLHPSRPPSEWLPKPRTGARNVVAPSSSRAYHSSSSSFRITKWYTNLLDNHPVVTKMVSSGIIAASGDALCQSWFPTSGDVAHDVEAASGGQGEPGTSQVHAVHDVHEGRRLPPWDWMRTGRFGILGAFLVAPTVHVWYNQLHRWTSNLPISSSPWRLLASRVAIDQLLFAPAFTAAWLVALRMLEQGHPKHIDLISLRASVPDIVVANWALWVPAQLVNFAVVPLKFQVLYSNVVALAWNVYLSYTTSTSSNRTSASRNLSTSRATRISGP